ncbi:MAG: hypothetical protein GWN71_05195, partial [Gammaproteobacteria bacterium]|nr:hypothetical protein [Gemmatimonadota bacterium]NIU72988.1 hypothetical protein [Gammaproteobacteria bacterium]NIY07509.1 hypothetical protein [Gemmatimonadota bacterium]
AAGDPRRAVELYTGPFLDGFFLPDAPGFEHWLSAERERLSRAHAGALEQLAEAASARGHGGEAVELWRRVVAHDPYSARTVLRLMEALEAAGNRAAALRQARDHSELLRADFGADPNPEVEALVERLQHTTRFRIRRQEKRTRRSGGPPAAAPAGAAQETSHSRGALRWRTVLGPTSLLLVVLLVGVFWARPDGPSPPGVEGLDPRVVAVLPFRVAAANPSLGYLHEGMVELLHAKLTGGGSRAVNPRAVMSAVRRMDGDGAAFSTDGARSLGRSLGAGSVLLGEVTSVAARVALSAQLLDVRTGRVAASAAVAGPADSLLGLLDELVIELLARENDEAEYRVGSLTTTSLPAAAAYLRGMASHRRGQYDSAIMSLERAIALDSAFALAALGLVEATLWGTSDYPVYRAIRLAWSLRDRLSSRDRILLEGLTGAPPPFMLTGNVLKARKRAVLAVPDRPEAWLELGDVFFHWGRFHGIDAPLQQAEAAFRRALELDSAFAAPLLHLVELAVTREDTVEIRALRDLYLAQASTSDLAG